MSTFPIRRGIFAALLFLGVFVVPFPIVAVLACAGILFAPLFVEGVMVFIIAELLYGGTGAWTPFPYMLTFGALVFLLAVTAFRRILRRRTS